MVEGLSVLRDLALLAAADRLLKWCSPEAAQAYLRRLVVAFEPIETVEEAQRMARRLDGYGSCLSRSLAVAARTPTADVVIGVEPRPGESPFAHAWVEIGGVPLDASDVAGTVIAKLRGPRSLAPR